MSFSHTSSHVALIDKYIKRTTAVELGDLSDEAKAKLTKLGYPTATRRKRRDSRESEEDVEDESHRPRPQRPRRH